MFLKIVGTCNDYAIVSLVSILKNILKLVQIIGPILLGIALVVILTKLVTNPDDKKLFKKLRNSIIALLFVFAVPIIVNAFIHMLDDSVEFTTCWNYDDVEVKLDSKYINTHTGDKSKIYNDPNDYEKGDEKKDTSGGASVGPSNANISKRIFIGDSRTVQMYAHLTGNWSGANYSSGGVHVVGDDVFVCQGGEGLAWMKSTGIPEATKYMGNGSAVIILMGVNDLYNLNEYIKYINNNYSNWTSKGAVVYFDSVNPCTGSYASRLNNKIVSFNNGMKQALSSDIRYIDSHSNLISTGYKTTDGLHYSSDTSKKIYNYIKSNL